jgi:hypothetical protein
LYRTTSAELLGLNTQRAKTLTPPLTIDTTQGQGLAAQALKRDFRCAIDTDPILACIHALHSLANAAPLLDVTLRFSQIKPAFRLNPGHVTTVADPTQHLEIFD